MEVHAFELGSLQVSAYVVVDGDQAVLIDAPEEAERLIEFCESRVLEPHTLINTHGHGDHIYANAMIRKRWPAIVLAIGKADEAMLTSPLRNLSVMLGQLVKSPKADRLLVEGDVVTVGAAELEVLDTPGHTPGGISLLARQGPDGRPAVFTGDALFAGSIGRTDFPGADHDTLLESIRTKLLVLPPDTVVYPGHGPETTIGEEVAGNPWL
jgi:glyoxylase-like metal-dependent hydrolase (beta-lactamase superfamily II)